MKQVAGQTQNANVPAAFMFGTVTKKSPLTIRVDNRFDISGDAIVLMKEFKAGAYPTHTHRSVRRIFRIACFMASVSSTKPATRPASMSSL